MTTNQNRSFLTYRRYSTEIVEILYSWSINSIIAMPSTDVKALQLKDGQPESLHADLLGPYYLPH